MADVIIVGAGLAGLCCGLRLREIGVAFTILEAADAVGGRVRTDLVDGFRLDRGFQVLLTAYPEAQRMLDYGPLQLRAFIPGVLVRRRGQFARFSDPRRDFRHIASSVFSPIGSLADKFRLLSLLHKINSGTIDDQFAKTEGLTLDLLRWHGFSETMIADFFRPLFGGIFLERDLVTSSRLFRFVMRMMAAGPVVVPATGMCAVPQQLAGRLPPDLIRLNSPVESVAPGVVRLQNGAQERAKAIVIATEATTAGRLLGDRIKTPATRGVTCLYFAAAKSPVGEPIVVFNADESGPIHNLAVMSDVASTYAPPGASLVSVSVLGSSPELDSNLESAVREQLGRWYGPGVNDWRHLRTYRIQHALPDQTAPALDPPRKSVDLGDGLFVCGDHRETASIDGAMGSGWRAAQAAAAWLDS
jgi:phytoene dehydrogenase-like protein